MISRTAEPRGRACGPQQFKGFDQAGRPSPGAGRTSIGVQSAAIRDRLSLRLELRPGGPFKLALKGSLRPAVEGPLLPPNTIKAHRLPVFEQAMVAFLAAIKRFATKAFAPVGLPPRRGPRKVPN